MRDVTSARSVASETTKDLQESNKECAVAGAGALSLRPEVFSLDEAKLPPLLSSDYYLKNKVSAINKDKRLIGEPFYTVPLFYIPHESSTFQSVRNVIRPPSSKPCTLEKNRINWDNIHSKLDKSYGDDILKSLVSSNQSNIVKHSSPLFNGLKERLVGRKPKEKNSDIIRGKYHIIASDEMYEELTRKTNETLLLGSKFYPKNYTNDENTNEVLRENIPGNVDWSGQGVHQKTINGQLTSNNVGHTSESDSRHHSISVGKQEFMFTGKQRLNSTLRNEPFHYSSAEKHSNPTLVEHRPKHKHEIYRQCPIFVNKQKKLMPLDKLSNCVLVKHIRNSIFVSNRSSPMFVSKLSNHMSVDNRSNHMFVGYHSNSMFVGQHSYPMFVGKRKHHIFIGKRKNSTFMIKRQDHMLVGKRKIPMFLGKRQNPMFLGKRQNPMFLGKRQNPMFLGKRRNPMFVGRQQSPMLVGIQKNPTFAGKPQNPMFTGKQQPIFVGKRQNHMFVGK